MSRRKIDRPRVYLKFDGHCGYCGKKLAINEMQIDHINPLWNAKDDSVNDFDNLMPSCRRCNHYKREKDLEQFRKYLLSLHERISKDYKNMVAVDYGIITIKPFDGVFFYEKIKT